MDQVSDYTGNLFSHVAAVYRPGERDMAVEFVEALGCAAADTAAKADSGSPFIAVHPNPDDRDPINNVFYLSEMMPEQFALEQALNIEAETMRAAAARPGSRARAPATSTAGRRGAEPQSRTSSPASASVASPKRDACSSNMVR